LNTTDESRQFATFWKTFKYRPTASILKTHEDEITRTRKAIGNDPNILVLGATPELRTLALKNHCKVTSVDHSMTVINAMAEFMDSGLDQRREVVVKCDWVDMPLEWRAYDLVLGDGSLNELASLQEYDRLLKKLKDLLKPSGRISFNLGVLPDDWLPTEVVDTLKRARTGSKGKSPFEVFRPFEIVKMMFSLEAYDAKSSQISYERLVEQLKRDLKKGEIRKSEFNLFLNAYGLDETYPLAVIPSFWMKSIRTFPHKGEAEKLLKKHFHVVAKMSQPEAPVGWTYLLSRE
jgi:SAM-dependent methyltransferase